MKKIYPHIAIRSLLRLGAVCSLGLLLACSKLPPPNNDQALQIVNQYLKDYGGTLEVHEGLGRTRFYRPVRLLRVQTDKCYTIANDAYWCHFTVEHSTAQEGRVTSPIALRIEIQNDQYRAIAF